ncbi:response regulator [Phormidesmis priestleyi]|uniref:response regulator n=1 Tax=Phormidesmis priestleyi TaxID=268141 RepID=UPI000944DE2A|nr:response regulator [Phormidesmis priestleyi]
MRILFVEDDDRIADAVTEALTDQHSLVEPAADELAGWNLLEAFSYDLLFLDIMLPKLDGIRLCQRLCDRRGYQLPVSPVLLASPTTATQFRRPES